MNVNPYRVKVVSAVLVAALLFAVGGVFVLKAAYADTASRGVSALNTPVTENFDGLASSGTSGALPPGFVFSEMGTSADTSYTANNGSNSTGDTYSYGTTSTTERALGGLRSGALVSTFGASFTNNTGSTINSLTVSYTGEQWRLGTAGRQDRLDFSYSTNATTLTNGTYTDVNELDFSSPSTANTGAKDGNATNSTITYAIRNLSIPNGTTFFVRWTDFDALNSDDGLAVDDFSLTAKANNRPVANNDPATAGDPAYAINEDGGTLEVPANAGVLSNDTDVDGDALTAVRENGPASGSLSLANGGGFTYTPNANFNGADTFTYRANDGVAFSNQAATATLTVRPVNDKPSFSLPANPDQTAAEDAPARSVAGFATNISKGPANESDQTLQFIVSAADPSLFTSGGQPAMDPATGNLTYTPKPDANGATRLGVTLKDRGGTERGGVDTSDTKTFNVGIPPDNDRPTANNVDRAMTEDASPITMDLRDAASDVETSDAALTYNVTGPPKTQGDFTPTSTNGIYTFDSADDFNGTVEVPYTVTDRGDPDNCSAAPCDAPKTSEQKKVTIAVRALNDAPDAKDDPDDTPAYQVKEDGTLRVLGASDGDDATDERTPGVLSNDTDADGDALSVADNDSNAPGVQPVEGPDNAGGFALNADGSFTYEPERDYNGPDSFTYKVCDDGESYNAANQQLEDDPKCDEAKVTIGVTAVNDPPEPDDEEATTDEDTPVVIDVLDGDERGPDAAIDEASQTLGVDASHLANHQPANGEAVVITQDTLGGILYTPDEDYSNDSNSRDTFTYEVCDDGARPECAEADVSVMVDPVNDAPGFTARGDETVIEDSKFPDETMQEARKHAVSGWIPSFDPDATGTDGQGNDSEANQTVEDYIVTDVNGDPLDSELFAAGGQPDVTNEGNLTYSLAPDASGSAGFSVAVKDSGPDDGDNEDTSDAQTFTITVNPDNDAPTLALNNPDQSVEENSTGPDDTDTRKHTVSNFATGAPGGGADEDDQNVTFEVSNNNGSLFEAQPGITGDGTLTYMLAENENGKATVRVSAVDDDGTPNDTSDDATSEVRTFTITIAPINSKPTAGDVSPDAVNEDAGNVEIDLSGGVSDTETTDENLTYEITGPNDEGTLDPEMDNGNPVPGGYVFNPARHYNTAGGTLDLQYIVTDRGDPDYCDDADPPAQGCDAPETSDPATIHIDVDPINDAPSFALPTGNDLNRSVAEDSDAQTVSNFATSISKGADNESTQTLRFDVAGDDNDLFADGGQPAIDARTGDLTYEPKADANGTAIVTVKLVDDGPGGTDTQPDVDGNDNTSDERTFTITVTPLNQAPEAGNDSALTDEDGDNVVVDLSTLVTDEETANEDLDALAYEISEGGGPTPEQGEVRVSGSTLTYDPAQYFNTGSGALVLTYSVTDRGDPDGCDPDDPPAQGCDDTGTLTVTVNPVNNEPTADDDDYSIAEDGTLMANGESSNPKGVLDGDTDPDDDSLQAQLASNVSHGQLTFNSADGTFTYEPERDYNGPDQFTYRADDGGARNNLSDLATATITVKPVNDAPTADNADRQTIEDGDNVSIDLSTLASDRETTNPANLAYAISGNGGLATEKGTVTRNGPALTYDPADDFNDSVSIPYTVTDRGDPDDCGAADEDCAGTESATGTLSVTVDPTNDAPTAVDDGADAPVSLKEDGSKVIDVLANDTDTDNPDNSNAGLSVVAASISIPAHGAGTLIQSGDDSGKVLYTPNNNYNGPDSFTYKVSDGQAGSTRSATVSVSVSAVNDAPSADSDAAATDEDTPVDINVLDNDSDAEGNDLTISDFDAISSEGGTVTKNENGTLQYTPKPNFHGTDTFTYRATDGSLRSEVATVSITVGAVNDKPIPGDDTKSTPENQPITFLANTLTANDEPGPDSATDELNQSLRVTGVGSARHGTASLSEDGQQVTFTPEHNFNGAASFRYTVCDNGSPEACATMEATVNVTISAVNSAPVAEDFAADTGEDNPVSVDLAEHVSDDETLDADLDYAIAQGPGAEQGEATLSGSSLTFTPKRDFHGTATVRYSVTDDGDGGAPAKTSEATLTITVGLANDAPTATDDSASTPEETPTDINVLANDTDPDGDTITVAIVSQPGKGAATVNGDGTVHYAPNANATGRDTFTYKVSDGTADSNTATVAIDIGAANDAPRANDDPTSGAYDMDEDGTLTVNDQDGVLANDADDDGDGLTAAKVSNPAHGQVALDQNGSFVYTPNTDYNGDDSFTYKANDGTVDSNEATVRIQVASVPDAPKANADEATTLEDTQKDIDVLANDTDADGGSLTVEIRESPTKGTATIGQDNKVAYKPNTNANGSDSFEYRICGANGRCSREANVSVTITPVNDNPDAADDSARTAKNKAVNVNVLANDADVDGDRLNVASFGQPNKGKVSRNQNGTLKFTPARNFTGNVSFTYRVEDGKGGGDTATVTITVTRK